MVESDSVNIFKTRLQHFATFLYINISFHTNIKVFANPTYLYLVLILFSKEVDIEAVACVHFFVTLRYFLRHYRGRLEGEILLSPTYTVAWWVVVDPAGGI